MCFSRVVLIGVCAGLCVRVSAGERMMPFSYGAEVGYGFQQPYGTTPPSHVRMAFVHLQTIPTLAGSTEHGTSFQWIGELTLGQSIHPGSRFVVGISGVPRLNVHLAGRLGAFWDAGAGVSSFGLRKIPETKGWMQYKLESGIGVRWRWSESMTLLARYSMIHFSNNDTSKPNRGLNLHTILVGVNF